MSGNTLGIHFSFLISNFSLLITHFSFERSDLSGGYCGGVPPLPIPNREVKPACADGTAMQCGRVGGRHFFLEAPCFSNETGCFLVKNLVFCFFFRTFAGG